jgi:pteridine reductase
VRRGASAPPSRGTLHAAGASVIVHCNRSRDDAEALADELNDVRGDSCAVVQADLLQVAACRSLPRRRRASSGASTAW